MIKFIVVYGFGGRMRSQPIRAKDAVAAEKEFKRRYPHYEFVTATAETPLVEVAAQ